MDELFQMFVVILFVVVLCAYYINQRLQKIELLIEDIHINTLSPSDIKERKK